MEAISSMLRAYDRNPSSLSAPDIAPELLAYLRTLTEAEQVESRRSDPHFGYGSDRTYRCVGSSGVRLVLLWGNTDGWGALDVTEK